MKQISKAEDILKYLPEVTPDMVRGDLNVILHGNTGMVKFLLAEGHESQLADGWASRKKYLTDVLTEDFKPKNWESLNMLLRLMDSPSKMTHETLSHWMSAHDAYLPVRNDYNFLKSLYSLEGVINLGLATGKIDGGEPLEVTRVEAPPLEPPKQHKPTPVTGRTEKEYYEAITGIR